MAFEILSTEYLSNHQYFKARKDKYQTPTGKIVEEYFVVEMPDSACALAITADDNVVLIHQYRYPIGVMSIELPGGFIDPNEPIEKAIARELLEETGYRFAEIVHIGKTYSNPGVLNNTTQLFVATGGIKVTSQSLDGNEEIEIILKTKEEVKEMMKLHTFKQSMHELCLLKGFVYLEEKRGYH
jgi:ADP-ribose pyrophosphatase